MASRDQVMNKLKELVTTNKLFEAKKLLETELEKSPNDMTLLTHMGGLQTSLKNNGKAEYYYRRAINSNVKQSGSARFQLMRLYSSTGNHKKLLDEILDALKYEPKSINLQNQLLSVYMEINDYQNAVKCSRELITRMQAAMKQAKTKAYLEYISKTNGNVSKNINDDENEEMRDFERIKYLTDPNMQSELYFMHSQILNKLGRYSDGIYYCKKSLETLLSFYQGMNKPIPRTAHQIYGYLGLCHLNNDDIDKALQCFDKAVKLHPNDATSIKNIVNIKHNRSIFESCKKLKVEITKFEASEKAKKNAKDDTTESESKDDFDKAAMREKYLKYYRLMIQVSRSATVRIEIAQWLFKFDQLSDETQRLNLLLGYHVPNLLIIYEDALRVEISILASKLRKGIRDMLESSQLRSDYGPTMFYKHNRRQQERINSNLLLSKIWNLRMKIDESYKKGIKYSPTNATLHVAYSLALWRLGYTANGIYEKSQGWIENNPEIEWEQNPKIYMARGNAYMNESQNEKALSEFGHALRISLRLKMDKCVKTHKRATSKDGDSIQAAIKSQSQLFAKEQSDEIQTRLLMIVLLNKMNNINAAANHCEAILAYDAKHESARKLYAAILLRQKKYRQSKVIFSELLQMSPFDKNTVFEFVNLLIETQEYDAAKKRLQMLLRRNPFDLETLFQYGTICYLKKEYTEAIKTFKNILKRDAMYLKCYLQLIKVLKDSYFADKEKDLTLYFEKWIAVTGVLNSAQPKTMYLEYLWENAKNHKKAKKLFTQWIKQLKSDLKQQKASLNASNEEKSGGNESKSQEDLLFNDSEFIGQKIIKLKENLCEIYQQYGRLLTKENLSNVAKQLKSESKENESKTNGDNSNNSSNNNKNLEENAHKMREEIIDCFNNALKYNGESTDTLRGFAGFHVSMNQYKEALPLLEKALELAPADSNTRIQLSRLYRKLEKGPKGRQDAKELLSKGIDKLKMKNLSNLYEELIDLYILDGDTNGADKYVWKLLEIDPTNSAGLRSVHSTSNDEEKVNKMFQNVCLKAPYCVTALAEYGNFLFINKKYKEASKYLKQAVDKGPQHCAAHYMYGFLLLQLDKKDEALEYMKKAVEINPQNFYAQLNLGQYLLANNDLDGAMKHIPHAYSLSKDNPVIIALYCKLLVMRADQLQEKTNKGGALSDEYSEMMSRADQLCHDALNDYPGHVALLMARSTIFKVMNKYGLQSLSSDDITGTNPNGDKKTNDSKKNLIPQTAYGMVGISIAKPPPRSDTNKNTESQEMKASSNSNSNDPSES